MCCTPPPLRRCHRRRLRRPPPTSLDSEGRDGGKEVDGERLPYRKTRFFPSSKRKPLQKEILANGSYWPIWGNYGSSDLEAFGIFLQAKEKHRGGKASTSFDGISIGEGLRRAVRGKLKRNVRKMKRTVNETSTNKVSTKPHKNKVSSWCFEPVRKNTSQLGIVIPERGWSAKK